jgi:hypothetical protein
LFEQPTDVPHSGWYGAVTRRGQVTPVDEGQGFASQDRCTNGATIDTQAQDRVGHGCSFRSHSAKASKNSWGIGVRFN